MLKTFIKDEKIKIWPDDWDLHLIRSCQLYFDEGKPEAIDLTSFSSTFVSGCISVFASPSATPNDIHSLIQRESLILQIMFKKGKEDKYYGSIFNRDNPAGKEVIGTVFRIIRFVSDFNELINSTGSFFPAGHGLYIAKPIGFLRCASGYECAQKIEDIIRRDKDDDNDNGGNPVEPVDPVNSLDLQPQLAR